MIPVNTRKMPIIGICEYVYPGEDVERAKAKLKSYIQRNYPDIVVEDEHFEFYDNFLTLSYEDGSHEVVYR